MKNTTPTALLSFPYRLALFPASPSLPPFLRYLIIFLISYVLHFYLSFSLQCCIFLFCFLPPTSILFSLPLQFIWQYETWPLTLAEIPEIFVVFVSEHTRTHAGTGTHTGTRTHTHTHTHTHLHKSQMLFPTALELEEDRGLLRWSMGPWGWQHGHDCLLCQPPLPWNSTETEPHQRPQLTTKGERKRE